MDNKLVLHTLSGFEGAGKSTIINHYKDNLGYFVIPETARLIIPLEDNVLRDSKDDLSYKSFISYLTNLHFLLSNNLNINCISDRNLIDSLTYLELYSSEQKMKTDDISFFVDNFLKTYNRDYFYDDMFLILHPKNEEYIEKNILSDKERKYGINVFQYKREAEIWENIFIDICEKLKNSALFKNLYIVESYSENKEIIKNIEKITKKITWLIILFIR